MPPAAQVGKRTLTEALGVGPPRAAPSARPTGQASIQQRAAHRGDPTAIHEAAQRGIATPTSPLPHAETLQRAFGHHDVSSIEAHVGSDAAASARAMGAEAYATGNHVVLGGGTDLHTVAHEAAHVVQLKGGVGAVGDEYERHADQVADAVVAGRSAIDLLSVLSPPAGTAPAAHEPSATAATDVPVQRQPILGNNTTAGQEYTDDRGGPTMRSVQDWPDWYDVGGLVVGHYKETDQYQTQDGSYWDPVTQKLFTVDNLGWYSDGTSRYYYDSKNYVLFHEGTGLDQQGLDQQGLDQQGLDQQGFDQQGFDQQSFDQQGFPSQGNYQQGFGQQGLDQQGLDQQGFGQQGLDQQGYPSQGYYQQGFDQQGYYPQDPRFDQQGYSSQGNNNNSIEETPDDEAPIDLDTIEVPAIGVKELKEWGISSTSSARLIIGSLVDAQSWTEAWSVLKGWNTHYKEFEAKPKAPSEDTGAKKQTLKRRRDEESPRKLTAEECRLQSKHVQSLHQDLKREQELPKTKARKTELDKLTVDGTDYALSPLSTDGAFYDVYDIVDKRPIISKTSNQDLVLRIPKRGPDQALARQGMLDYKAISQHVSVPEVRNDPRKDGYFLVEKIAHGCDPRPWRAASSLKSLPSVDQERLASIRETLRLNARSGHQVVPDFRPSNLRFRAKDDPEVVLVDFTDEAKLRTQQVDPDEFAREMKHFLHEFCGTQQNWLYTYLTEGMPEDLVLRIERVNLF